MIKSEGIAAGSRELMSTVPAFDLARLQSSSFLQGVEFHDELDSTNSRALQRAACADCACPLLVLAEHQHRGRGRGEHRWWSSAGAMTFSVIVNADDYGLSLRNCPRVALAAGLAVCDGILAVLPGEEVRLKWPNDVYLRGRKVCGILVEGLPAPVPRLVIGIGINANNCLQTAPDELRSRATSLVDVTGHVLDRTGLLLEILQHLASVLRLLGTSEFSLAQRWQPYCMLQGRTLSVQWGPRRLEGVCRGIDGDGALLLQTVTGLESCFAGVVTHVDDG
jgi:BirA family transcriptional regulator, biotin operon repressor / biotin---[acetyl-CoA-carboxylase] ligase